MCMSGWPCAVPPHLCPLLGTLMPHVASAAWSVGGQRHPLPLMQWWSQRVALEHASEEEWLTMLGESSHAMSQAVRDIPAWVTPLVQAFTCPPGAPATLSLPETWSNHQAVRFLEAFGPTHPADTESFVHTAPQEFCTSTRTLHAIQQRWKRCSTRTSQASCCRLSCGPWSSNST